MSHIEQSESTPPSYSSGSLGANVLDFGLVILVASLGVVHDDDGAIGYGDGSVVGFIVVRCEGGPTMGGLVVEAQVLWYDLSSSSRS